MVSGTGRRLLLVAVTVAGLAIVPALAAAQPARGVVQDSGTGLSTNYDFAQLVLRDGGWPVSVNNVAVLTQWLRAEEPASDWWDRDNPLNNGLGSGGGSGLGSYGSVVTAAYDVALNLKNQGYGYPRIVHDLATSAPQSATTAAIWRSSWAAGHYGNGADWGTYPVPSVAAPPSAWQSPTRCPIHYPAHEVGPCGPGFTTTGATWHSGAPEGVRGQELWAFSRGVTPRDTATWTPTLAAGSYAVSAYLPALFDDATVGYVVRDSTGAHRVVVNQEPYSNAWVPLGVFTATGLVGITVTIGTGPRDGAASTYVAADAMRFAPLAHAGPEVAALPTPPLELIARPPGAPLDVTAVAGDASTSVSWLAPSKDGGATIKGFTAVAVPGGQSCATTALVAGEQTCAIHGLTDGVSYQFVVRATNRIGIGPRSSPSNPVRPLGHASLVAKVVGSTLQFGDRVVFHATFTPSTDAGTVLFADDGAVVPGCARAKVVAGSASCATRLTVVGPHRVVLTYSGSSAVAGVQTAVSFRTTRAPTSFQVTVDPVSAVDGTLVTLQASHLPGLATGRIIFSAGAARLCVAMAKSGGGSCTDALHLTDGPHLVRATYVGDRSFLAAVARTTLRVLAAPTS